MPQTLTDISNNPFLQPYGTPHNTVPFHKIKIEHYEEAFLEGIRRDSEAVQRIIDDPAEPTFQNTIARRETGKGKHYYDLLDRVSNAFSVMLGAETCDELDALAQKLSPILTKHANDVKLNAKLFARVKHVYDSRPELSGEERMLLEDCYDSFVRSGAMLDDEGKERFRTLTEELGLLSLQFSQNLLKETKAFTLHITDEADLAGLPKTATDAAASAAAEQGKEGWLFSLDAPLYNPFMSYSDRRELRRMMYMERNSLCMKGNGEDNREICKRIVNLRMELAQLVGYPTYADFVLKRRMAGTKDGVYGLLRSLLEAYTPTAVKERDSLLAFAKEKEGDGFQMEPWDVAYYAQKQKKELYDLDPEALRPYFNLPKVVEGVFGLANRLYGISFRIDKEIPVYHPDVEAYEVADADGSYIATLYTDFFPRKGKQGGAWMTELQGQWIDHDGENNRPHVCVVMNFTKPSEDKPALLTLGEVETFLHEFGHALHGMLSNCRFESLSGTNVWWDFVELPSQIMENFAVEPAFLETFAEHYLTGEHIPGEMIGKIRAARNFRVASACLRQLSFGLLDMAYYTQESPFTGDVTAFEKEAMAPAAVEEQRKDTGMTVQFGHIMSGGYAAGYYSYKWAEVLDADAFSVFSTGGIFNKDTATSFRRNILERGATEHPMDLYKRFRGQAPTIDALLRRDGIGR